jgi:solute carrier family 12 sodium/potassium/chloride transporter 2
MCPLPPAPRVLQSMTSDRLFPALNLFSVGYGPNNEPIRGYVATLAITVSMVLVGDLNTIAALITNFFLLAYALVNLSCFCSSYWHAPGWRPSFKYYSMWTSLVGAVVCVAVMFLISWVTAVITLLAGAALFIYLHYARPDVNWGSAGQVEWRMVFFGFWFWVFDHPGKKTDAPSCVHRYLLSKYSCPIPPLSSPGRT